MREDLVGYLMGAIDDSEREEIDARLQSDPEFRERLAHVEQKLSPLGYDESPITAPAGLADRTLAFIDQNSKANLASPVTSNSVTSHSLANTSGPALETGSKYRRDTLGSESDGWSFSDFVVAAGVCLAAACLF